MHHFGVDNVGGQVNKNSPPAWLKNNDEREQWAREQLECMIDKIFLPAWSGAMDRDDASENVG